LSDGFEARHFDLFTLIRLRKNSREMLVRMDDEDDIVVDFYKSVNPLKH
jgi:hypothetical protein